MSILGAPIEFKHIVGPRPGLARTLVGIGVMQQLMLVVGRQMCVDGSFG